MSSQPLSKPAFREAYTNYLNENGYAYEEFDIDHEWARYSRGRSWLLYTFHGEHALAVVKQLQIGDNVL